MRIIGTEADLAEGLAHLARVEPRFAHAVAVAGVPPVEAREEGFAALFYILVGQQISVAAANGIWRRIEAAGADDPARVLAMDEEALKGLGLSRPKARYAKAIAGAIQDGSLDLGACARLPVDEAMRMLMAVKGIGTWTAELYLMFCVGRADIFADKDLALQEAARLLFDLDARPTHRELGAMAEAWSPWRGVAARVLWRYYRHAKGRAGVGSGTKGPSA